MRRLSIGIVDIVLVRLIMSVQGKRGVLMTVENLSGRVLGAPRLHVRCGWKDEQLGEVGPLNSTVKEIFLFHNYKKSMRSSCGSLSWQVQDRSGRAQRLAGGRGVRLFLTWSLLDTGLGPNKCKDQKRNQFVLGFAQVALDTEGREVDWEESGVYSREHTEQGLATTFQSEQNSLTSVLTSPDDSLEVRAVLGPGCLTDLNVTVLGKRRAALQM